MSWQRGWGAAGIGSDARPVNRGRMVTLSQGELSDMVAEARRKARRAFTYAMVIGAVLGIGVAAGATRAFGETISIGNSYVYGRQANQTTVTIAPSSAPGEWAVVVLDNRYVNDGNDDGDYVLSLDGTQIGIAFQWDAVPLLGSDRITATPPEGIVCIPDDCAVTVMEGMTGRIVLIDWRGM